MEIFDFRSFDIVFKAETKPVINNYAIGPRVIPRFLGDCIEGREVNRIVIE